MLPKLRARYPEQQDPNEQGLQLLRAQYEQAGFPHLAWGDTKPRRDRIVQIYISPNDGAPIVTVAGDPKQIAQLATLICRAVNLGWLMLNELEPVSERERDQPQPVKNSEKSANTKEESK